MVVATTASGYSSPNDESLNNLINSSLESKVENCEDKKKSRTEMKGSSTSKS